MRKSGAGDADLSGFGFEEGLLTETLSHLGISGRSQQCDAPLDRRRTGWRKRTESFDFSEHAKHRPRLQSFGFQQSRANRVRANLLIRINATAVEARYGLQVSVAQQMAQL